MIESMKVATKTNKAVCYCRRSTGKQDITLEMQHEKLTAYCQMQNLEVVEWIEDTKTAKGKLSKRPSGTKITQLLKEGVCHIVALKLDRLFRNAADALTNAEEWQQAGISLHLVDLGGMAVDTSSSMGKMLLTMLAGFAEFERNIIAERTEQALTFKRENHKMFNHVPYGFRLQNSARDAKTGKLVDDTLLENHVEKAVVAHMKSLRAAGKSYWYIADSLTATNTPTKSGGRWAAQTVKNILAAA